MNYMKYRLPFNLGKEYLCIIPEGLRHLAELTEMLDDEQLEKFVEQYTVTHTFDSFVGLVVKGPNGELMQYAVAKEKTRNKALDSAREMNSRVRSDFATVESLNIFSKPTSRSVPSLEPECKIDFYNILKDEDDIQFRIACNIDHMNLREIKYKDFELNFSNYELELDFKDNTLEDGVVFIGYYIDCKLVNGEIKINSKTLTMRDCVYEAFCDDIEKSNGEVSQIMRDYFIKNSFEGVE